MDIRRWLCFPALCLGLASSPHAARAATDVSLVPSRSSGVAPLYVFFDATGTTTTATGDDELMDLLYTWDFGDPDAGTWTVSGRPKNSATGFAAAHVFEKPGTYTVTLKVSDAAGASQTVTRSIAVQDPEVVFGAAKTTCFSASGSFTGCPSGAQRVTTNRFESVLSSVATGKRLLLHRGETFSANSDGSAVGSGPGLIGAFGSGAKPVVAVGPGGVKVIMASDWSDWRLVDLNFVGSDGSGTGLWGEKTMRNVLVLRCDASGLKHAVLSEGSTLAYYGVAMNDGLAIVDGKYERNSNNNLFVTSWRLALLGNVVTGSGAHGIRSGFATPGVIQHNRVERVDSRSFHLLKLHAPLWGGNLGLPAGTYNEKIVLSDNVFRDGTVYISPQNGSSDERIRRVLAERNLVDDTGLGEAGMFLVEASSSVVRNQIHRLSKETEIIGFARRGIEPSPVGNRAYNNSCYSKAAGQRVNCIVFHPENSGHAASNNLLYAPGTYSGSRAVEDQTGTGVLSNNWNPSAFSRSPFVSADPITPADFRLATGAPLIDAGANVAVRDDFGSFIRSGARDVGAWEYGGASSGSPAAGPGPLAAPVLLE